MATNPNRDEVFRSYLGIEDPEQWHLFTEHRLAKVELIGQGSVYVKLPESPPSNADPVGVGIWGADRPIPIQQYPYSKQPRVPRCPALCHGPGHPIRCCLPAGHHGVHEISLEPEPEASDRYGGLRRQLKMLVNSVAAGGYQPAFEGRIAEAVSELRAILRDMEHLAGQGVAEPAEPEDLQSDSIPELIDHVMRQHGGQFGRCAFADLERIKILAGKVEVDRARLARLDALLAREDPPLGLLDQTCYGAGQNEVGVAKVETVKRAWRWFRERLADRNS